MIWKKITVSVELGAHFSCFKWLTRIKLVDLQYNTVQQISNHWLWDALEKLSYSEKNVGGSSTPTQATFALHAHRPRFTTARISFRESKLFVHRNTQANSRWLTAVKRLQIQRGKPELNFPGSITLIIMSRWEYPLNRSCTVWSKLSRTRILCSLPNSLRCSNWIRLKTTKRLRAVFISCSVRKTHR